MLLIVSYKSISILNKSQSFFYLVFAMYVFICHEYSKLSYSSKEIVRNKSMEN